MKIKKFNLFGILFGLVFIVVALFFYGTTYFLFFIGIGVLIISLPFVLTAISESNQESEKEEMFLEFARNLVESVKTGTPISKSIVNLKNRNYGVLTKYVHKLANQISLGVSLNKSLDVFAKDVNNKTISRALTLIGQAERAGGNIGEILESVAEAVSTSDKLKKERKAAISTLIVQGYIIFIIFMVIVLVMQFKIIPMVSSLSGGASINLGGMTTATQEVSNQEVTQSFFWLIIFQGFFSGLAIGKLAEGNLKAGVKHSFALVLLAFLVSSAANLFIPS